MFNRYWRTYPWGLQVALFLLMIFTLMSFATYLVLALMPKLTGLKFADFTELTASSSLKAVRASLTAQGLYHASIFAIPGFLFASFAHPRLRNYLGLRLPGKPLHWLLVTGIMLGLIPTFLWGEAWMMQHLHFGKWADDMQEASDKMIGNFFRLNAPGDLFLVFFVLAILPAVGEEVVFRGVFLRLLHQRFNRPLFQLGESPVAQTTDANRSMLGPVLMTAFIFAAIHSNPYGFTFIFIAGCVMALIYFLTGSLLCSMWAHLLYNGTQVVAVFASQHDAKAKQIAEGQNLPVIYPIIGLLLFCSCFYLLIKNQTPLPADWSDDFKEERKQENPALPLS